jgi:hypothetical protein
VANLVGVSGRTLIFDDGTRLPLPCCFSVEDSGTVFLISATHGRLTQVAVAPAGSARADVERHVWQTLDGLNRRGWWHQG